MAYMNNTDVYNTWKQTQKFWGTKFPVSCHWNTGTESTVKWDKHVDCVSTNSLVLKAKIVN